jgi:hypothetical protein
MGESLSQLNGFVNHSALSKDHIISHFGQLAAGLEFCRLRKKLHYSLITVKIALTFRYESNALVTKVVEHRRKAPSLPKTTLRFAFIRRSEKR